MIENIKKRISCRTYRNESLEAGKLDALKAVLASSTQAPFGNRVRFELFDFEKMSADEIRACGTYGVIKGARQFIVGAVVKAERAMEDYGFCLEKIILYATGMGLGTCWLGGTFRRTGFAARIRLSDNELLPAVTPVGYAGDGRSVIDRVFRLGAGSNRRKPWGGLFFDENLRPLEREKAGPYATALDCVRIGPSASNKQPWRIIRDGRIPSFHFFLQRTPGYGDYGEVRLQNVDMGIAMCHFEQSARELSLDGQWQVAEPNIEARGMEYVVSWHGSGKNGT
jgi:hypothetical protein